MPGATRVIKVTGLPDLARVRLILIKQPMIEIESITASVLCGAGRSSLVWCLFLGSSPSLLQNALLGASRKRVQVNEVKPTLWNAVEEMRARRATLRMLRLGLLGDTLTDGGLNRLGQALWELQVSKVRRGGTFIRGGRYPSESLPPRW